MTAGLRRRVVELTHAAYIHTHIYIYIYIYINIYINIHIY